jgi:hypothetical protein
MKTTHEALRECLYALKKLQHTMPNVECNNFHHNKKDQHGFDEPCPVLDRFESAKLEAATAINRAEEALKQQTEQEQFANIGWLHAVDEAMVSAHIGVANLSDSYESAKAKLNSLIDWHIEVATDPAVNGGFSLQPEAAGVPDASKQFHDWAIAEHAMLAAAPQPPERPEQSPEQLGYVPLSDDCKMVFIDGIGEVPLDFGKRSHPPPYDTTKWRLVPTRLNEQMEDAALTACGLDCIEADRLYKAWLEAAPQPPQQPATEYEKQNPLGGPAKVFDAMADAIRAGDSYESVLKLYGYAEAQKPAEWVGLTVDEFYDLDDVGRKSVLEYGKAIEAKLREKNQR